MTELNSESMAGGAIVSTTKKTLPQMIEKAEDKAQAIILMRETGIRNTVLADWIDQGTKYAYLTSDGAVGIGHLFGVVIQGTHELPMQTVAHVEGPDELIFTIEGNVTIYGLATIPAMGCCSTRDDLLGKKGGNYKPIIEINLPNVKKKAHTNFVGNGIKHSLKLNSITWQEWEILTGLKRSNLEKVERMGGSGKRKALDKETQAKLEEMKSWAADFCQRDGKAISKYLFELTDNPDKGFKGAQRFESLSEAQINKFLYKIFKAKWQKFKKEEGKAPEQSQTQSEKNKAVTDDMRAELFMDLKEKYGEKSIPGILKSRLQNSGIEEVDQIQSIEDYGKVLSAIKGDANAND